MAYGTGTLATTQAREDVSCGFKPKYVVVEVAATGGRVQTFIYDSRMSTTRVQLNNNAGVGTNYSTNSGYSGYLNLNNGAGTDFGLTSDGFFFKQAYAGTYHYIAIPE